MGDFKGRSASSATTATPKCDLDEIAETPADTPEPDPFELNGGEVGTEAGKLVPAPESTDVPSTAPSSDRLEDPFGLPEAEDAVDRPLEEVGNVGADPSQ